MPKTPTPKPIEVTADEAMPMLDVTTRAGVTYLIHAGKLQARKASPSKQTSVWLITVASIEALVEERKQAEKKRAQAVKA